MSETIEAQLGCLSQGNAFLNKYFSLRKRCEQLQQANEKLVNRVQHVKKLIKRYKRDRRYLISRLDEFGDGFREAQVPVMWEEDELFNCLRPPPPYPGSSGSDSDLTSSWHGRAEHQSALSAIQPLLAAHGLGESTLAAVAASVTGNSSSKGKKVKTEKDRERDPNAPKKPANAFLMFSQQRRSVIQEEYLKEHKEEIAHHELTRRLAQQWNNLSQDDKKLYYELYEHEKERYEKEMREYSARETVAPSEDTIPVPAREGTIPSPSLQMKKERD
ncbi:hypothetical protein BaRGS_00013821 [Batillaria attramentaria]|uniref:HMG box domain-containing protein n=1 Tax=Batillaria attramentaria TaxID=370345 RepID=A0ABD0L671_9CAEN